MPAPATTVVCPGGSLPALPPHLLPQCPPVTISEHPHSPPPPPPRPPKTPPSECPPPESSRLWTVHFVCRPSECTSTSTSTCEALHEVGVNSQAVTGSPGRIALAIWVTGVVGLGDGSANHKGALFGLIKFVFPPTDAGEGVSAALWAWYEQQAGALEGCQWRRSSRVELFELGFWFWLCELGWGLGKGARLAALARVGVGGGGSHQSHQVAATCCAGGGGCGRKPMAEAPKGVGAPPRESAVQAVENVKEPEREAGEDKAGEDKEEEEGDVEELLAQHQDLVDSMLAEGILDDQFSQLQMLQDESTPDFVEEVVTLFFDDSAKLLENLAESLKADPLDYTVVDGHVHQFKGSSSSIGAQRVKQVCVSFRHCCDKKDKQGCLDHLTKVNEEFNIVRSKLGKMLELEKKIVDLGGVLPFMEC